MIKYRMIMVDTEELEYDIDEVLDQYPGVTIFDGLTKLEVSQCIEALREVRDSMSQNLKDGLYTHDCTGLITEVIASDTALIEKMENIWKEMPVEDQDGDSVDQQYELMMELIAIDITDIARDSYGLDLDADILGELSQKLYDAECGTGDGPDYQVDMRDRVDIIKEILDDYITGSRDSAC